MRVPSSMPPRSDAADRAAVVGPDSARGTDGHELTDPPRGLRALARAIGPGLVVGVSDDDPSGIGTYSQAGAQFGLSMLWVMVYSLPLMIAVQLMSAWVGRVTGRGLAANLRRRCPRAFLVPVVWLLFATNTVNVAADLAAMAEATRLLVRGPTLLWVVVYASITMLAQIFLSYERFALALKGLSVSVFAYVAAAFVVHVDWGAALRHAVVPAFSLDGEFVLALVAVVGTTFSPYMVFWQASQEVEEQAAAPGERPLREAPRQAPAQLGKVALDTWFGMFTSNLVGFFIIVTTAATLHVQGVREIASAADAARALEPVAGASAGALFAIGLVCTGLLALPVLAGSAAYAVADTHGWRARLGDRPRRAPRFYVAIGAVFVIALLIDLLPFNPMHALVWTAVLNGIIGVPIVGATVWIATRRDVMGDFAASPSMKRLGWMATVVLAVCALATAFA